VALPLSLDLFEIAAQDDRAAERERAPVQEVLTLLGPATPTLTAPAEAAEPRHYGPAESLIGGIAHVNSHGEVWYEDIRPCPFPRVGEPPHPVHVDKHCVAIMPDGDWRWACIDCAVFAKKGQSDMVPGAPWRQKKWRPCAKCGGDRKTDHVYAEGKRWCDDECTIEYSEAPEAAAA
jgi:hypothetical protein